MEVTPKLNYSSQPFGVDVSRYQGRIDWDQMTNGPIKVRFAGIRLGVSWGYVDPWFPHNWAESSRMGCPRGAYHVFYPGEAIKPQVDLIARTLGSDLGDLPVVPDIELAHGLGPSKIQPAVREYVFRIRDLIKRTPIIYSRTEWWNTNVTGMGDPPDWYAELYWWLALYLKTSFPHPGPLTAPRGVPADRVLIHQVSDHTPSLGFGISQADSKQLDYDRWLKSEAELLSLANKPAPVQDPVAIHTHENEIAKLNEVIAALGG